MTRYAAFERAAYSESQQIDSAAVPILIELLFGPKYVLPLALSFS